METEIKTPSYSCLVSSKEYKEVFAAIKKNATLPDDQIITEVGDDWSSDNGSSFSKPCGCGCGVIMTAEINSDGDIFFEIEPNEPEPNDGE